MIKLRGHGNKFHATVTIFFGCNCTKLFICPYGQTYATKTLETKSVEIFKQLFFKLEAMNKNIVVASVALLLDEEEQTRKKRWAQTIWTRPWMLHRKIDGAFHTIFRTGF